MPPHPRAPAQKKITMGGRKPPNVSLGGKEPAVYRPKHAAAAAPPPVASRMEKPTPSEELEETERLMPRKVKKPILLDDRLLSIVRAGNVCCEEIGDLHDFSLKTPATAPPAPPSPAAPTLTNEKLVRPEDLDFSLEL